MTDPSERFSELLPCGCELAQGTWFYCAEHQSYQAVSKTVVETVGQRQRMIQVPIDDPREAV